MYNEKILKASSWKDRSTQSADQSCTEGISSGMKRPPSVASPLSTTSSNESYSVLVTRDVRSCFHCDKHRMSHHGY